MLTILSVPFYSSSIKSLLSVVQQWISQNKKTYICVTNVYVVVESQRNKAFLQILQTSGMNVADGMPLVWIGKMLGYSQIERAYGPMLMKRICGISQQQGYKIFLYGTTTSTLSLLIQELKQQFPKLIIVGSFAPPFRSLSEKENKEVFNKINASGAHVVFVGIGTPKQEIWMYQARKKLQANILIGVGAAFDFIAGTKKQAPRWMQQIGLEWLFRMVQEPRRLWKRYLINNILFCYYCFRLLISK